MSNQVSSENVEGQIIVISSDSENDGEISLLPSNIKINFPETEKNISAVTANAKTESNIMTDGHLGSKTEKSNTDDENTTKTDEDESVDSLLERFITACLPLMKEDHNPQGIISLVRKRHANSTDSFKSSEKYSNVLKKFIKKLESGSKLVYVYINDVTTLLTQHSTKKNKRQCSDQVSASTSSTKKLKLITLSNELEANETPRTTNGEASAQKHEIGESSTAGDNLQKQELHNEKLNAKIAYLEDVLKLLATGIKKHQAHELSLEEMDQEDSSYIQENKLKAKLMKVFAKLCKLKNVPVRTGRAMEQSIKVTSSRFPEINQKIENYINRKNDFPDFCDINYLVKLCNKKHNLQLTPKQINSMSRSLFEEVGIQLKRRRHYDFVYNFGCYLTDPMTDKLEENDPAKSSNDLKETLSSSGVQGKLALKEVIEKYSRLQEESGIPSTQSGGCKSISDDSNAGSEPPSEEEHVSEDEESDESDYESNSDVISLSDNDVDVVSN